MHLFKNMVCVALVLGCTSGSVALAASAAKTVTIEKGAAQKGPAGFGTNPLVVAPGTTVTWTNHDTDPHTVTSDSGAFDSGTLQAGQSFSHTFKDAGKFPYFCAVHGKAAMSGAVDVKP